MIEKKYDPSEAERRIYDMWESKGLFKPGMARMGSRALMVRAPLR